MNASEKKVLLIDDNPLDRRVYRRFLQNQSELFLHVIEAGSAQAGIDACRLHSPDCVILDFKLPDRDGLSLLEDLRELSHAPVILITGELEPLTETKAYQKGVVRYLSKDFLSAETLQGAVRDALRTDSKRNQKT